MQFLKRSMEEINNENKRENDEVVIDDDLSKMSNAALPKKAWITEVFNDLNNRILSFKNHRYEFLTL